MYLLSDVISSHVMRKTAITTKLKLGMPEFAVKKISGHSSSSKAFHRYVEVSQSFLDEKCEEVFEKMKM